MRPALYWSQSSSRIVASPMKVRADGRLTEPSPTRYVLLTCLGSSLSLPRRLRSDSRSSECRMRSGCPRRAEWLGSPGITAPFAKKTLLLVSSTSKPANKLAMPDVFPCMQHQSIRFQSTLWTHARNCGCLQSHSRSRCASMLGLAFHASTDKERAPGAFMATLIVSSIIAALIRAMRSFTLS